MNTMRPILAIDTHCHINLPDFMADHEDVAARAAEQGVAMIVVGIDKESSQRAVEQANIYPNTWAIIGLHPINAAPYMDETGMVNDYEVFDYDFYKELAKDPKVVGIGECGFDYFRSPDEFKDLQKKAFEEQIWLANEIGKPLMLHLRNAKDGKADAYADALKILKDLAKVPVNAHFYAGTKEQAQQFLDLGGSLSFNGVITFTQDYDDLVRFVPLDRLMSETDSPYLAPVPYRGRRNEPVHVLEVVKKIAEIKGIEQGECEKALLKNAARRYGLKFS